MKEISIKGSSCISIFQLREDHFTHDTITHSAKVNLWAWSKVSDNFCQYVPLAGPWILVFSYEITGYNEC